jgi:hypothetical protein
MTARCFGQKQNNLSGRCFADDVRRRYLLTARADGGCKTLGLYNTHQPMPNSSFILRAHKWNNTPAHAMGSGIMGNRSALSLHCVRVPVLISFYPLKNHFIPVMLTVLFYFPHFPCFSFPLSYFICYP